MLKWFKRKKLKDILDQKKKVKIHGVIFYIRKINPLDYLDGSNAMKQLFDTYQHSQDQNILPKSIKNIKKHYADVILAGVVSPELSRKEHDGDKIFIENLFTDWSLVDGLYEKIMEHTYGKKKVKFATSPKRSS